MDLIATLQTMLRRWYVVVPTLLLSIVGVGLVYTAIQPTYQASGSVILRGPEQNEDPKTGARNRYADYNNLAVPAKVIVDALSQKTYQEKLKKAGMPGGYKIQMDPASAAPIVAVIGQGETPADAIRTTRTVMNAADAELAHRQDNLGAPKETFLTTEVVTAPTEAEPLNGSRLRAAAGVFVIGMVLTMSAGFTAEAVARRRQQRVRQLALADGQAGDGTVAEAFECGLCGEILPAADIVDHLTDEHGFSTHGEQLEALFGKDHNLLNGESNGSFRTAQLRSGTHR